MRSSIRFLPRTPLHITGGNNKLNKYETFYCLCGKKSCMQVSDKIDHEFQTAQNRQGSSILSNGKGGFCVLSCQPLSRYDGVFGKKRQGVVFKFLDAIETSEPVLEVTNRLWGIQRRTNGGIQTITMPRGFNALIVKQEEVNPRHACSSRIVLDCKGAYDNREWGRHYGMEKIPRGVLFSFSKRVDARDIDNSFGDYDQFVAIYAPQGLWEQEEGWLVRKYERDLQRISPPFERYVFSAGSLTAKEFVVSFGFSKSQALSDAIRVWNGRVDLLAKEKARVATWVHCLHQVPQVYDVAYACAANALECLVVDQRDVYAGLPWFFQFWARDSAVSTKALALIGCEKVARCFLVDAIHSLSQGLDLPTHKGGFHEPWKTPQSFDGVLWAYVRIGQLLDDMPALFSKEDKIAIKLQLEKTVFRVQTMSPDGLIINGPKETWMDTEFEGDNRAGSRIEMQALALAALRLACRLGVRAPEDKMASQVRKVFWNGRYLHDGKDDPTIRPNLFIAAYVYPDLLSAKEWKSCVEAVLPKLWLPWGGLSSIAVDHPLFCSESTGEQVKSYHRGDSWFWINNLAAIVLHRLDKMRYKPYIEKILEASTHELLFGGAVGHHAEISSASHLSSEGCLSQAWSNAMYIELLSELFQKNV